MPTLTEPATCADCGDEVESPGLCHGCARYAAAEPTPPGLACLLPIWEPEAVVEDSLSLADWLHNEASKYERKSGPRPAFVARRLHELACFAESNLCHEPQDIDDREAVYADEIAEKLALRKLADDAVFYSEPGLV